ncbi:orotidine 5'-phosphate decarboxylase [Candidatus Woesearchaeota archaeon]|nr:orotidine 5'-phosphate decarboxylase [Candidatus Woesearchaeota archaeon]
MKAASHIIAAERSIIPACDVPTLARLRRLVESTHAVDGVGAYKVGFQLTIPYGLNAVVRTIKDITDKPVIYDHQKAATDIPDMGAGFADACRRSGVDAVILFPQAGPATEAEWIRQALAAGLKVIVGGEMSHRSYLKADGGYLDDSAPERMYTLAAKEGVTDFVVPGNKPERIAHYRKILERLGTTPVFYSPGLVAQGGTITDGAKAAGRSWHAIIGRGIYRADDMTAAAEEHASRLT